MLYLFRLLYLLSWADEQGIGQVDERRLLEGKVCNAAVEALAHTETLPDQQLHIVKNNTKKNLPDKHKNKKNKRK